MATVTHKVYALARERPGITSENCAGALGTDVDRALRRLVQVRYVEVSALGEEPRLLLPDRLSVTQLSLEMRAR